ncbi:hypothetical protein BDR22DRAFT_891314 [Usnea florida]
MAKFTDLSNEFVLIIASFIRKPADILNLCIADRRTHDFILPLLYTNIVLHHLDYPTKRQHSLSSNVDSLCALLDRQQNRYRSGHTNGPDFGAECRSLSIVMYHSGRSPVYSAIELFTFLPFLKSLSLVIGRRPSSYPPDYEFPIGKLSQALNRLGNTLEKLTLYITHPWDFCGKDGIGSLRGFNAMKQLRIQSAMLVGGGTTWHEMDNPGPSLSQILPPNLEDLTIHCCFYCGLEDTSIIADHFETRPGKETFSGSFGSSQLFMGTDPRVIENVVVCMQDPYHIRSKVAGESSRLASCFDIVGRNMISAGEK